MAREGYPFLAVLLGIAAVTLLWGSWLGAIGWAVLAAFVAFFFRDPERIIPPDDSLIVSPADGKIVGIRDEDSGTRVSIFLSIFDVHINRAPVSGRIVRQQYHTGKFHFAFDDRASIENERMDWTLQGKATLNFSLIAGLIARRIVAWKREGEDVARGDRIGLIKFGSRVDITLPLGCRVVAARGQRVRGGETVLAHMENPVEKEQVPPQ